MPADRAALDVDDLLKIILVLVILWLVLEVLETVLSITLGLFSSVPSIIGLVVIALIVLWYFDYL